MKGTSTVVKKKTFDQIITNILFSFEKEFTIDSPMNMFFLINPETQCFHYYGKDYYRKKLNDSGDINLLKEQVEKALNGIKANDLENFYDLENMDLNDYSKENYVDIYAHLLTQTPVSRYFGLAGRVFHTGLPLLCKNREEVDKSGILKLIQNDEILGDMTNPLNDVITSLECVLWGKVNFREIICCMAAPICVWGQVSGVTFVTSNKEHGLNYYDFMEFIEVIRGFAISDIRDAKEYEFLSEVIKSLPENNFDVVNTVLKKIYVLFNISAACLHYTNTSSKLTFVKKSEKFPVWQNQDCNDCSVFSTIKKDEDLVLNGSICKKISDEGNLLKTESGLYVCNENAQLIIYFNSNNEMLKYHGSYLRLEIEDAFELISLVENNIEFFRAYEHDTDRFLNIIPLEENIEEVLRNRISLMSKLTGGKIENDDVDMSEGKDEIAKKISSLFDLIQANWKRSDSLKPEIVVSTDIEFWPPIETILHNLIINTFENLSLSQKSNVSIELSRKNNYVVVTYKQTGLFEFKHSAEDVKKWLFGKYCADMTGFAHYIIQKIANRFYGKLEIILRKNGTSFTINKKSIEEAKWDINSNEQEVIYRVYLIINKSEEE